MRTLVILAAMLILIPSGLACQPLTDFMDQYNVTRFWTGDYSICAGTYGPTAIVIMDKGVSIRCQRDTHIIGPGELLLTTWSIGVEFPLGEIVHADFLMEGCTFTEFMVGVGGFEVDEDEQHELHLSDGDLTLVN
ncbi:MAG: hypothetical protein ABIH41_02595, partial [Nanoarchaeota archaeon]